MHDKELISGYLSFFFTDKTSLQRAVQATLAHFKNFSALLSASAEDLQMVSGMGEAGRVQHLVVHELALRLLFEKVDRQNIFHKEEHLMAYLTARLAWEKKEQLRVLFIDEKNRLLGDILLAEGTLDQAFFSAREFALKALSVKAHAVIMVHNHPSGTPTPSVADREMTLHVFKVCKALSLVLYDHIIIGKKGWTSLKQEDFFKEMQAMAAK